MPRPRLFIDVSIIARKDTRTGIQRVVRALWSALKSRSQDEFEVIPIAGSARSAYRRIPDDFLERPLHRLPIQRWKWRVTPHDGDVFLGLDLSLKVVTRNAAQIRRWQANGMKIAYMVYDLLPDLRPGWFTENTSVVYRAWLNQIVNEADLLVCISDTVAADLKKWVAARQIPSPKITSVRLSGAINESLPSTGMPFDASSTLAWARSGTCVLMVGTVEPRKGYQQALAAFEDLWAHPFPGDDFKLLIVGRPGWHTEVIQHRLRYHPMAGRRLRWLHDVSDEYLQQLYGACWGLLIASRGEGLGLPLLEAAAHAKPILARDLQVFREVACEGVTFFAGDNASSLAKAIRAWRAAAIVALAIPDARSWGHTAEELQVLIGALRSPPGKRKITETHH